MKKRITAFLGLILILTCVLCLLTVPVFADSGNISSLQLDEDYIKETLKNFVENHNDRTGGSVGEKSAAEYLKDRFQELNLEPYGTDYLTEFKYMLNEVEKTSYNVAGKILANNNPDSKNWVYIGAHYDNVYGITGSNKADIKSHGAYDNGTGVSTMLAIAKAIKDNGLTFDFNIAFIAFGSEEYGMLGSSKFVKDLSIVQLEKSLIMFNLDSIGAGDSTYLYTTEKKSKHHDFIFDVAAFNNTGILNPPANKNISFGEIYFSDFNYSHIGMRSDNASFNNRGILTASLYSFNWELSKYKLIQSKDNTNLIHTSNDNFETLTGDYPEFAAVSAKAGSVVLNSISTSGFESVMIDSKNSLPDLSFFNNRWILFGIGFGIFAVSAGVSVWLYFIYKKRAVQNGDTLKGRPAVNVNTVPPSAEHIFGFGDSAQNGNFNNNSQEERGKDTVFGDEFDD